MLGKSQINSRNGRSYIRRDLEEGVRISRTVGRPEGRVLGGYFFLTFFTFSSACAIAGLRAGFSDLDANYCSGVGSDWCNKMVTACVFGMLTFVSLLPSVLLNSANAVGPW